MANYALTVTPKFTPFTYDELVKPVEAYQKVYDAYNENYDENNNYENDEELNCCYVIKTYFKMCS